MLREAMDRKGRDAGGRYTFRDLERDSGVNYSYAARVSRGERQPSRDVVKAFSEALFPYLPIEEAMVAAGYVAEGERRGSILRNLARLSLDALEDVERYARRRLLAGKPADEQPDPEASGSPEREQDEHEPHP